MRVYQGSMNEQTPQHKCLEPHPKLKRSHLKKLNFKAKSQKSDKCCREEDRGEMDRLKTSCASFAPKRVCGGRIIAKYGPSEENLCCFWSVQTDPLTSLFHQFAVSAVWMLQKQHKFSILGLQLLSPHTRAEMSFLIYDVINYFSIYQSLERHSLETGLKPSPSLKCLAK